MDPTHAPETVVEILLDRQHDNRQDLYDNLVPPPDHPQTRGTGTLGSRLRGPIPSRSVYFLLQQHKVNELSRSRPIAHRRGMGSRVDHQ